MTPLQRQFLTALAAHGTDSEAYLVTGISRAVVYGWRYDAEFLAAREATVDKFLDELEERAVQLASES